LLKEMMSPLLAALDTEVKGVSWAEKKEAVV
jgi:hypothetical protein